MATKHSRGRGRLASPDHHQQQLPLSFAENISRSPAPPASTDARLQLPVQDLNGRGDSRRIFLDLRSHRTLPFFTLSTEPRKPSGRRKGVRTGLAVAGAGAVAIAVMANFAVTVRLSERVTHNVLEEQITRPPAPAVPEDHQRQLGPGPAASSSSERSLELGAAGALGITQCPAAPPLH